MARKNKNSCLLARVNFPLYCIERLSSRHILVAGGGGSSKTGVTNGFEVFELMFDGSQFVFKEILRHETGGNAVMNCAVYSNSKHTYLVAGQEAHCQLYNVRCNVFNETYAGLSNNVPNKTDGNKIRNRKTNEVPDNTIESCTRNDDKESEKSLPREDDNEENAESLQFILQPADCIKTDFSEEEPFQRIVRISKSGHMLVTGGTDGYVRVWKFPSFNKLLDISAHNLEIDDLDISTDETQIISISKNKAVVWDSSSGDRIHSIEWNPPNGTKYIYKRCRYGPIENESRKSRLFILCNPVDKPNNKPSYIQLWDPETGVMIKQIRNNESLSALTVRDDGRFIAVGTMFTGSIIVFTAFNLKKVLKIPKAHSVFITGLEFLPSLDRLEDSITTVAEVAVLSISIDNKICIHYLPYEYELPLWIVAILMILAILLAFIFCDYIGL